MVIVRTGGYIVHDNIHKYNTTPSVETVPKSKDMIQTPHRSRVTYPHGSSSKSYGSRKRTSKRKPPQQVSFSKRSKLL